MFNFNIFILILVLSTFLCSGQPPVAVLTIDPNWTPFFTGESVTLRCDMNEGQDSDWAYQVSINGRILISNSQFKNYIIEHLTTDFSGKYYCCGQRRGSQHTKCSYGVNILVLADKPRATLTASPTAIPVGGNVTLSCSIGTFAGWKYSWFRQNSPTTVGTTNNEENKDITVTKGGVYCCGGSRGKPVFYAYLSAWVTIQITISNKVVVTRQPSWPELFSGETITLTCEVQGGETTEWTYEWRRSGSNIDMSYSKDRTFIASESSSGDYTCRCRRRDDRYSSTRWSEAITLSVSDKPNVQLRADSTELALGGRVNLICSVNSSASSSSGWKYFWYRGEKPSQPLATREAVIPSNGKMSVSEEEQYWCRGGRGEPVYYTDYSDHVNITVVSCPVSSLFPVLLIVGPVIGIILVILLLFLWRYRRSKDVFCIRCEILKHTSQTCPASNEVTQNERTEYSSPFQVLEESGEITYCHIELKNLGEMRRPRATEGVVIYSEVKPGAGDFSMN